MFTILTNPAYWNTLVSTTGIYSTHISKHTRTNGSLHNTEARRVKQSVNWTNGFVWHWHLQPPRHWWSLPLLEWRSCMSHHDCLSVPHVWHCNEWIDSSWFCRRKQLPKHNQICCPMFFSLSSVASHWARKGLYQWTTSCIMCVVVLQSLLSV